MAVPARPQPYGHGCRQSPELGVQPEACGEGIPPRLNPVRDRDLSPPRDTELLPQRVGMRLRRPRRDAKAPADLVVRASGRYQLDDLPLTLGDRGRHVCAGGVHGGDANTGPAATPLTERRIFAALGVAA
jgi:hypothetical protein